MDIKDIRISVLKNALNGPDALAFARKNAFPGISETMFSEIVRRTDSRLNKFKDMYGDLSAEEF